MSKIDILRHLACTAILVSCPLTALTQENGAQKNDTQVENTDDEASSPATGPTVIKKTIPDIAGKKDQLLAKELKDNAIQWQENEHGRFPIIWESEGSGNPYGALLFIHGAGQTLDWPHTIHMLRKNLVKFGWSTLAIGMPDIDPISIPERPIENSANEDKATNSPTPPPAENNLISNETVADSRIKTAIEFLQKKGQFNIVVVAYGVSAARAAVFIGGAPQKSTTAPMKPGAKAVIERPIRALVMIAASNYPPQQTTLLTEFFNDPGLPVLDIHFGNHYLDNSAALKRLEGARRQRMESYEQSRMLEPNIDISNSNRLARRVRGFLNKYAKGVEISK